VSEWREIWANGLPSAGRSPNSGHRMAAEGMRFPWRWDGGTIFPNLDVIWGMSINSNSVFGLAYPMPGPQRFALPLAAATFSLHALPKAGFRGPSAVLRALN